MALPIAPTPVLRGKDVDEFNKIVKKGIENKKPIPQKPNLESVRQKLKAHAKGKK